MREGATLPPRLGSRRPSIPVAILAIGAVLCGAGAFGGGSVGQSMILVGLGSVALFLGVIMIAGRLIRPLVAIVGAPLGASAVPRADWPAATQPATPRVQPPLLPR